ncbi:unnamed protein product [Rodentolepis nana]|uniref:Folliculin n=1 Tax=Rodentolepis nana TaxID=102285 RepID=A0A0R3TXG9_RODNA|nr:unnamed protein product [Rodentolepis nana]
MDAVVVLCHFCETHGPAVIMCTQPLRQVPLPLSRKTSTGATPLASSSCGSFHAASTSASHEGIIWPGEHNALMYTTITAELINSTALPQSTGAVQDIGGTRGKTTSCRACSIITHDEIGFVSHDSSSKTDYVSTQFPNDVELLKAIRTACMRSLSSEIVTSEEGPMYFGDDVNRHVMSYNFSVKDSMARGSQVRYSFLLITWNQIFLMNLWPFLVRCFKTMASRIKAACLTLYEEETASGSPPGGGIATITTTAAAVARSATPPAGVNSLRLCRTPPPPSSGSTLALHQHLTTGGQYNTASRYGNTSTAIGNPNNSTTPPGRVGGVGVVGVGLGGCPTPAPLSSSQAVAAGSALSLGIQNTVKKMKGLKISESEVRSLADLCRDDQIYYRVHAWFTWLLRITSRVWVPIELKNGAPLDEDEAVEEEVKNNSGSSISSYLVDPSTLALGVDLGWTDGQLDVEAAVQMRLLSDLYKCIGDVNFQRLVYYLGIGNQVIVRSQVKSKVGAFTTVSLARLLPRGCIRCVSAHTT